LELLLRGGEIDPLVLRRTTVILQKLNIMLWGYFVEIWLEFCQYARTSIFQKIILLDDG
jgi:uncharacterized membrane protein YczE